MFGHTQPSRNDGSSLLTGARIALVAASLLTALSAVAASPVPVVVNSTTFPVPDQDPFYFQAGNIYNDKPGKIYKTRVAQNIGIAGATGVQLLFRTIDPVGNPKTSVTTVITTAKSSTSFLVAYNMYEDAAYRGCAPSYCFNTDPTVAFCPSSDGSLQGLLSLGYAVVVTDFEGNTSGFSVGHMSGYQVLDGYRAAITHLKLARNVFLGGFGYSGGAIGTAWSAALQNVYAPELNIKALAFGGTPANATAGLLQLDGGSGAGLAVAAFAGYLASFPELNTRFQQIATAQGKAAIAKAQSQCAPADFGSFAGVSLLTTDFTSLGANLLKDPIVAKYMNMGNLATDPKETPTRPQLYMFHTDTDETVPYGPALKAAQTWCAEGARIEFTTRNGGTTHAQTQALYSPQAIEWLDSTLKDSHIVVRTCSFVTKELAV